MSVDADRPWRLLDPELVATLSRQVSASAVTAEVRGKLRGPLDAATAGNLEAAIAAAIEEFFAEATQTDGRADREGHRAQGRAQHAAGRTIEEMLAFYQLGGLAIWKQFSTLGAAAGIDLVGLAALGEALFAFIADLSTAAADGYAEARSQAARAGQAQRDRLIALLLADGPPSPHAVEVAAREAAWTLPARVAVAVTDQAAAAELMDQLPGRILVGHRGVTTCLVLPSELVESTLRRLQELREGRNVGLGPLVARDEAALSAQRAETVWQLAENGSFGAPGVVRASEHQIELMLAADLRLAAEFVRVTLAPLDSLPEPSRSRLTETLAAWLAQPDQPQAISMVLHVHVQTVRYRMRQLRELLGSTFDDPEGRFALALALRTRSLVDARQPPG